MAQARTTSAWPNLTVVLLCVLAPPLGLVAWIFGNPAQRALYLLATGCLAIGAVSVWWGLRQPAA